MRNAGARRAGAATALAVLLAAASCTVVPPAPARTLAPFTVPDYVDRAPVEVAILPAVPAPNFTADDAGVLRGHLYRELLAKGYTPLALDYVDQAVGGIVPTTPQAGPSEPPRIARLRPALATDAFLALDVLYVKTVPGAEPGVYQIDVRATLLDGETGSVLFDHRFDETYEVRFDSERRVPTSLRDDVLRRFAARLVSDLPARRSARSP